MDPEESEYPFKRHNLTLDVKQKITHIDAIDNQLVLGSQEGYIYSYEVMANGNTLMLDKNCIEVKRGKQIFKLKIVPRITMVAVVADKNFRLMNISALDKTQ